MRWSIPFVIAVVVCGCAGAQPAAPPRPPTVVEARSPKVVAPPSAAETAAWREAATYTNLGKNWLTSAASSDVTQTQEMLLGSARATYLCAVRAWTDALAITTARAYEVRFWLADAWNKVVRIEFILRTMASARHPAPTPEEIDSAIAAAIAVRDATDGSEYVDVAATFVINASDVLRDLDYLAFEETHGASGFPKRTAVEMEGPPDDAHVKVVPIPPSVARSIAARDDYVRRVPRAQDVANAAGVRSAVVYAFDAADVDFVYGQFPAARVRFETIYREECGLNEYGFRAWERLISIAAKSNDVAESRRLAEAVVEHSCAVTAEQRAIADGIQSHDLIDDSLNAADTAFVKACGRDLRLPADRCDSVTSGLVPRWRSTAALYLADFERAPASRTAPTGAFRAAFAYKQAGDLGAAVALYRRFLAAYDDDALLRALQARNDDRSYTERVAYGDMAYEELRYTELARFDLTSAATTDETAAAWVHLGAKERRAHALQALILLSAIGDRPRFDAMLVRLRALSPTPRDLAEAEYRRASFGAERGANVTSSLTAYFRANRGSPSAAPFVFEAAWTLSRLAMVTSDSALHRMWILNAKAARDAWEGHLTADDELAHAAAAPLFAQLERELAPAHVTSTTGMAAVFPFSSPSVGANPAPLVP